MLNVLHDISMLNRSAKVVVLRCCSDQGFVVNLFEQHVIDDDAITLL